MLAEHGLHNLTPVASWPQALALPRHQIALAVLGIELGFETADVAVISEEDILGERLVRARRQSKKRGKFHRRGDEPRPPAISSSMSITASAASSACAPSRRRARRTTASKSIMPAATNCSCRSRTSNCLSRYGSEEAGAELDRLGSGAWQSRKARMKNRIREIAGELIKIAAERQLREAPRLTVDTGAL